MPANRIRIRTALFAVSCLFLLGQPQMTVHAEESAAQMDVSADATAQTDEDVNQLLIWLEGQLEEGTLSTKEDIQAAVEAGGELFGVTLSQEGTDMLVSLIETVSDLGLDPQYLLEQGAKLYAEFGTDADSGGGFFQMLAAAIQQFFQAIWDFIAGIFSW